VVLGRDHKKKKEGKSERRGVGGEGGGGGGVLPLRAADFNGRKIEYFQWNGFLHSKNVTFLAKYKEIQQMLFF